MSDFKYYVISWVALLAAFNAIVFVCAAGNFTSAFWIGYAFITVAFVGQLICAAIAFKPENLTKKFYNMPIVTESYAGLILMLIFGGIFMTVPGLPQWPGIVICVAILALTIITVMQAAAVSDMVEAIDKKVADDTSFIKDMTAQAQALISKAKSEEVKAECVKVYEAFRYSPKRSDSSNTTVETEIIAKFAEFKSVVEKNDIERCADLSSELLSLRNNK